MTNKIIYEPPESDTIRHIAREVSVNLARQENDESYAQQVVIDGLTDYLRMMSELLAKHMNKQAN